jgi:hypothetical protein
MASWTSRLRHRDAGPPGHGAAACALARDAMTLVVAALALVGVLLAAASGVLLWLARRRARSRRPDAEAAPPSFCRTRASVPWMRRPATTPRPAEHANPFADPPMVQNPLARRAVDDPSATRTRRRSRSARQTQSEHRPSSADAPHVLSILSVRPDRMCHRCTRRSWRVRTRSTRTAPRSASLCWSRTTSRRRQDLPHRLASILFCLYPSVLDVHFWCSHIKRPFGQEARTKKVPQKSCGYPGPARLPSSTRSP